MAPISHNTISKGFQKYINSINLVEQERCINFDLANEYFLTTSWLHPLLQSEKSIMSKKLITILGVTGTQVC
jgi:hypothetical protein